MELNQKKINLTIPILNLLLINSKSFTHIPRFYDSNAFHGNFDVWHHIKPILLSRIVYRKLFMYIAAEKYWSRHMAFWMQRNKQEKSLILSKRDVP